MITRGIQQWKVDVTGNYKIKVVVAGVPESGRSMYSSIITTLTKGEVIQILVGQQSNKKINVLLV
jgi:hypothetical protein